MKIIKEKKRREHGRGVLHNISEKPRKKRRETPTSGYGWEYPREPPSGSRDHFRVRSGPLPVAAPRSTSANAN